jgi:hypothetical protein
MPAYTHRWFKTRDTPPNETSFECRAYPVEIVSPEPDMSEAADQLRHAQEQLAISRQYPGRTPHIPSRMFKPRTVK